MTPGVAVRRRPRTRALLAMRRSAAAALAAG